jgi:twinkle protein
VQEGSSKMDFIGNCAEQLERAKKHILAFDNDKNGNILKEEVARRIGKDKCWLVDFGDCKDANEYLVKHGKAELRLVIETAKEYPVAGIVTFDNFQMDLLKDLVENGHKGIYSTGWENVDKYYKVRSQELTVLTGKPNNGKSLWLDNLLINLAEQYGHKFLVCSLEVPQTKHFLALLEKICKRAKWVDYDGKNLLEFAENKHYEFLSNHFFLYQTEDNDITIDGILTKAREMVLRKGIRGLVIDPHNQVEHKRPSNQTEHEYIGDVLRKVREFAKNTGCHVWYVAHPRKIEAGKSVTGYDISGSANWVNMADNLIVVERVTDSEGLPTDATKIQVQKIRFQPEVGRQGFADLKFIAKMCRYE